MTNTSFFKTPILITLWCKNEKAVIHTYRTKKKESNFVVRAVLASVQYADLNIWIFSSCLNRLNDDIVRRWAGKLFQTIGAAIEKVLSL